MSGDWFFGLFLLRLSRTKRPKGMSMVKFSPMALNCYDFVLLIHFFGTPCMRFNGIVCLVKKMIWLLNMELYFCKSWFCVVGFRWKGRTENTKRRPGYFVIFLARVSLFMPLFEPICHDSNGVWRSKIVKTVGLNCILQKGMQCAQLYTQHRWAADVEETILGQSVLLHQG